MEYKAYNKNKTLDKFLSNIEPLETVEKTSLISIYSMVVIYSFLQVFFMCFFFLQDIPEMVFINIISILLCLLNLFCLIDLKKLTFGLLLWVANSCFYIISMTYILGYNKNSAIFLPVLLLLIHLIFPKKKKYLLLSTIIVILTAIINVHFKYNVASKYFDSLNYIDVINTFSALILAGLIIYLRAKSDQLVTLYNSKKLDGLAEKVDEFKTKANIDFLTGLWNRRYIETQLKIENFENAYIIIADIDFFKRVNDEYGHLCGDYILKEVASLFKTSFRNIDVVCRWGGEEFLIIINNANNLNVAEKLNRTRKSIEDANYEFNGNKFNITITFGFDTFDKTISLEENVEKADIALYYGKNNGRNCVCSYADAIANQ